MNKKLTKYLVLALVAVIAFAGCTNPAGPKITPEVPPEVPTVTDPLRIFIDVGDFVIYVNQTDRSKILTATTLPSDTDTDFAWKITNDPDDVAFMDPPITTIVPPYNSSVTVTADYEKLGFSQITVTATRGTETASTTVYCYSLFDVRGVDGVGGTIWVNAANNAYQLNDNNTFSYAAVYAGGPITGTDGTYASTGTIVTLTDTDSTTSYVIGFNGTKWELAGGWILQ
jgi:hypothetical protein